MANESINLNLIPTGEMPVIHVSQFDNGRAFNVNLLKGSDEYTIPVGYTAELHCRKADRNIVTLATTSVLSNTLTFTTTTQLCACAGDNLCEVAIKDSEDYLVGSLNFILEVEKDPLQGGIESTSEIHDLEDQIEDITTEIISENYYTKTETDTLLDAKADASDVYTKTEVDTALSAKANAADVYTKSQVDTALSAKANTADVYTKSQVDNALSAKANTADLATVATTGSYTDLTNKPDIPAAQVQSDYAQADNTKVDYIKNKPDLSIYAKESDLILATGTENEAPYQIRQAPSNIGNLALEKLVGVSCVFNQLVQNSNAVASYTKFDLTMTRLTDIFGWKIAGTYNYVSGDRNAYIFSGNPNISIIENHVYCMTKTSSKIGVYAYGVSFTGQQRLDKDCNGWVIKANASGNLNLSLNFGANIENGTVFNDDMKINIFDLTAMFGSGVADYIYTLESGNAGAGVSLFKSLFADEYYPYTANTLMSAKPTSKVIKDSNNQTVATIVYSGNELRGLLKVGTDGLYADGDTDDGSGSTQVRYELRAYQSGDESLTDAITDGTNTVVKLATPTTAVSTAWSNPIIAKEGGTEEFTDTRAVKIFTGHDTIYSKKPDYRYWG